MNKSNKSSYYNSRLNIKKNENGDETKYQNDVQSKVMWGTFKDLSHTNKQVPLRIILHDGNLVTSIKQIVNIANNFFIEKIRTIRESFPVNNNIVYCIFEHDDENDFPFSFISLSSYWEGLFEPC